MTYLIVRANVYDPAELADEAWAAIEVSPALVGRLRTAMDIITDTPLPISEIVLDDESVTYFSSFEDEILEVDDGDVVKREGDLPEGTRLNIGGKTLKVARGAFWFYGYFNRRSHVELDVTALNHAWLESALVEQCDWCGSGLSTLINIDNEKVCQDCLDRNNRLGFNRKDA